VDLEPVNLEPAETRTFEKGQFELYRVAQARVFSLTTELLLSPTALERQNACSACCHSA